jgi:hypothetical protein
MEHSAAYLILSLWIQHRLLVIRYVDLLNLLETLRSQGRITVEECNQLLEIAEHLRAYDLTISV